MNPLYMIPLCAACASVVFAEQEVNLEAFTSKGQMMFSDTSRGFSKAKDPAVVHFNDTHFMYYTVAPFHSNELHPIPLFTNFPPKANSQQYESRLADWHSHFINPTDTSADLFSSCCPLLQLFRNLAQPKIKPFNLWTGEGN